MDVLNNLLEEYTWVLGVLALVGIELSPIKINPIKYVGRLISSWLGIKEIKEDVNQLK